MQGALDIARELLARDVPHEIVRLRRDVLTSDEVPDVLELPPYLCVSVRGYIAEDAAGTSRFVAVAVPAGTWPDEDLLRIALDTDHLRRASATEVSAATDYRAGLVSPIGLPPDVDLVVDAALGASPVLYAPTGEGGTVVGLPIRDLLVLTRARIAALAPAIPLPETRPSAPLLHIG